MRASLNAAEEKARAVGAHMVMIGILPTLRPEHLTAETLSANPRYALLNEQIFAARGEDLRIAIDGVERLAVTADTITPEAACTSTQFHLQVSPAQFADYWNAAQAIAGIQVALGANSPFLFGRELWRGDPDPAVRAGHRHPVGGDQGPGGTPPGVVRRALDHRGVRPVRGERALLPGAAAGLRRRGPGGGAGRAATCRAWPSCGCTTAPSTAGTGRSTTWSAAGRTCGWRTGCCPPGPTVLDTIANGAFYFGLVRALAESDRPLWSQMSFSAAEENFHQLRPPRHRRAGVLAGPGLPAGDRAGAAPAAAAGARRAWTGGASTRPSGTGCSASSSSAA